MSIILGDTNHLPSRVTFPRLLPQPEACERSSRVALCYNKCDFKEKYPAILHVPNVSAYLMHNIGFIYFDPPRVNLSACHRAILRPFFPLERPLFLHSLQVLSDVALLFLPPLMIQASYPTTTGDSKLR